MTSGIHHITLVTRKVQANVDFYVGFLGLRLVKRTGGFEDAEQLHLFYGDSIGSPGSLITFLVWEDGAPGRVGLGQVAEIAFAVEPDSIGFWLTRALSFGLKVSGPAQEFGEPVLRLSDPDGVIVKLVGSPLEAGAPLPQARGVEPRDAIRRIRGASLLSAVPEQTSAFLQRYFGYRPLIRAGTTERLVSDSGDVIDVREATGFWPGIPGTGIADHVALRAKDEDELKAVEARLQQLNSGPVTVHDRKYFASLYVREPGETLIEMATDGPGMLVDEPLESLGSALLVPSADAAYAEDVRLRLPQFSLPDEDRVRYLDLPFVHRFHTPVEPDGNVIILLHGSGGNEADLMPFAARLAPHATLLGVRGRSTEEGNLRWFRRLAGGGFDQQDIRSEAAAFAAFIEELVAGYRLAPEKLSFIGYSNGANFLAAAMMLHPPLASRCLLLRPVSVLENPPQADLTGSRIVILDGRDDPYRQQHPSPADALRARCADVTSHMVHAGHELSPDDSAVARNLTTGWFA
ncbi:VOC family protein [Radicibacter daui]|uniref:VOC family protein n=1 Tax=Radicibacter daui TaxID=3064829 RepID=UPI004046CB81